MIKTKTLIIAGISIFIALSGILMFFRFMQYGADFRYYLIGFGIAILIIGGIIVTTLFEMKNRKDDD